MMVVDVSQKSAGAKKRDARYKSAKHDAAVIGGAVRRVQQRNECDKAERPDAERRLCQEEK